VLSHCVNFISNMRPLHQPTVSPPALPSFWRCSTVIGTFSLLSPSSSLAIYLTFLGCPSSPHRDEWRGHSSLRSKAARQFRPRRRRTFSALKVGYSTFGGARRATNRPPENRHLGSAKK